MKMRRKSYNKGDEEPSYWQSFVDMMSSAALIFFFIMILAMGYLTVFVDDISAKREKLYDQIETQLTASNVDKNLIRFNRDEGKLEIMTETFFDAGSSEIKEDGKNVAVLFNGIFSKLLEVDAIAKEIEYIEVVGHTDYSGTTFSNRKLSTDRAVSFLNEMVPMNSNLENKFGGKFKAAGMSEFETNKTLEERNKSEATYRKEDYVNDRKIEIKINFSNKDLETAIKERIKGKNLKGDK